MTYECIPTLVVGILESIATLVVVILRSIATLVVLMLSGWDTQGHSIF